MPLYSNTIEVDNVLNKTGTVILKEERSQIRKLFGITLQNSNYKRNTVTSNVDTPGVDNAGVVGFNNK